MASPTRGRSSEEPTNTGVLGGLVLSKTRSVGSAAHDRFVDVDIAVSDLYVEPAIGIGAHPGFVMDGGTLATVVG